MKRFYFLLFGLLNINIVFGKGFPPAIEVMHNSKPVIQRAASTNYFDPVTFINGIFTLPVTEGDSIFINAYDGNTGYPSDLRTYSLYYNDSLIINEPLLCQDAYSALVFQEGKYKIICSNDVTGIGFEFEVIYIHLVTVKESIPDFSFEITVAPNPISENSSIRISSSEIIKEIDVRIIDLTGKVLFVLNLYSEDTFYDIPIPYNQLSIGVYLTEVTLVGKTRIIKTIRN